MFFPSSRVFRVMGQTLVLPSIPGVVRGEGNCGDLAIGIASENWRVRKGDVFEASVFQPFGEVNDLAFAWEAVNGKIISGQGKSQVRIKAGSAKTPGYINASGFIGLSVKVTRKIGARVCSVESSHTIMVGRFRERNGFPKVDDIVLDKSELRLPCAADNVVPNSTDTLFVNVVVTASDPENDVLSYVYRVSGGKILETGANVRWDLSGAKPGIYHVVVGVDDGTGVHNTKRSAVAILECVGK